MANHVGGDGHTPVVDMRVNERRNIDGLLPDERPRPFLMMFHERKSPLRATHHQDLKSRERARFLTTARFQTC